jgi:hypothetical protein
MTSQIKFVNRLINLISLLSNSNDAQAISFEGYSNLFLVCKDLILFKRIKYLLTHDTNDFLDFPINSTMTGYSDT